MKRFVQLHLLTSYPPSNVNRDDLGRPKTAMMGGATRLRISSQSLKRAWRTSDAFKQALDGHIGTRTKQMGVRVYESLIEAGTSDKDAKEWAKAIAGQFGALKKGKSAKADDEEAVSDMPELEIEQLAHFSPAEEQRIDELAATLGAEQRAPSDEELDLLRKSHSAADIALFGRMLADTPKYNTDAAVQVAHAITVHKVAVESDYFTAVDDLNAGEAHRGAAHIGESEFGAGLFYLYINIDRQLLLDNLGGDQALASRTIGALITAATQVAPRGKQNSFGSTAHAIYGLAERGDQQPRSLSVAFLKPVWGESLAEAAIAALEDMRDKMDAAYDGCADSSETMNLIAGSGSLRQLVAFATE